MLGYAQYKNTGTPNYVVPWTEVIAQYAYISATSPTEIVQFPAHSITQIVWAMQCGEGGAAADPYCVMILEPVGGGHQLFDHYAGFQIENGNSVNSWSQTLLGTLMVDSDNLPVPLPWDFNVIDKNYAATVYCIFMSWAKP
jgi:hypothetical protein